MSNINNIESDRIKAWCDDYAALCLRHGLYIVSNKEMWLQQAGESQDAIEAAENMRKELMGI